MATIETYYPVFTRGQQLKSSDLNEIPSYLDRQNNLTRTQLIGMGIMHGFEVKWEDNDNGKALVVGKGLGISSQGHLFCLEEAKRFTHYEESPLPASYFFGETDERVFKAWRLTTSGALSLSDFFPIEPGCEDPKCRKCLIALREKIVGEESGGCFNGLEIKPRKISFKTSFFLVDDELLSKLGELPQPETRQFISFNGLPLPYLRRPDFSPREGGDPPTDRDRFLQVYRQVCQQGIGEIVTAFKALEDGHRIALGLDEVFGDAEANLKDILTACETDGGYCFPYFYEFLEDLVKAYRELLGIGKVTLPAKPIGVKENLFPHHLLLGGFGSLQSKCRTHKYCNFRCEQPDGSLEKARFLYRRLHVLLKENTVACLPKGVKFTPGKSYEHPLSQRAIPFYYKIEKTRPAWNYELTDQDRAQAIPSYHRGASAPNDEPLLYELESWGFYRIEGHAGMRLEEAVSVIKAEQMRLNVAFDLVSVPLDELTRQPESDTQYEDLEIAFHQLRLEWIIDLQPDDHALDLLKFLEDMEGKHLHQLDLQKLSDLANATSSEWNICKYKVVANLYNARAERVQSLVFKNFAQRHPGLEHLGGVQPGGTFVLVYDDRPIPNDPQQNRAAVVIADFCLPYLCCVKPLPPVNLPIFACFPIKEMCSNDAPKEVFTWPEGGRLLVSANSRFIPEAAAISPQNGRWQFDPSKLPADVFDRSGGATVLLRFLNSGKTIDIQTLRVQHPPVINFDLSANAIKLADGKLSVQVAVENLAAQNANSYTWKLEWLEGDQVLGTPVEVVLNASDLPFQNRLTIDVSPMMVRVTLTASRSDACPSRLSKTADILFPDPKEDRVEKTKGNVKSGKPAGKGNKTESSKEDTSDDSPSGGAPVSDTAHSLDTQGMLERRLSRYKTRFDALVAEDEAGGAAAVNAALFFLAPPRKATTQLRYLELTGSLLQNFDSLSPQGQGIRRQMVEVLTLCFWDKLFALGEAHFDAASAPGRELPEQCGSDVAELITRWRGEELATESPNPQTGQPATA